MFKFVKDIVNRLENVEKNQKTILNRVEKVEKNEKHLNSRFNEATTACDKNIVLFREFLDEYDSLYAYYDLDLNKWVDFREEQVKEWHVDKLKIGNKWIDRKRIYFYDRIHEEAKAEILKQLKDK